MMHKLRLFLFNNRALIVKAARILPVGLFIFLVGLYYVAPTGNTIISVSLTVSSVTLNNRNAISYNSDITDNLSLGSFETTGQIVYPVISNQVQASSIVRILPDEKNGLIRLNAFTIPKSSEVTLSKVVSSNFKITSKQMADEPLTYTYGFLNSTVLVDSKPAKISGAWPKDGKWHLLATELDTKERTIMNMEMKRLKYFHFPQIYVDTLSFNEKESDSVYFSSVLSGKIKFLDTKDDSISLSRGDTLALSMLKKPVKVIINVDTAGIHLKFDAQVDKVVAGPVIFNLTDLDRMPSRIQVLYDKQPYLWTLLIALLPIIATFLMSSKKQDK